MSLKLENARLEQIKALVVFCEELPERYRLIVFQDLMKQQDRPMYFSEQT